MRRASYRDYRDRLLRHNNGHTFPQPGNYINYYIEEFWPPFQDALFDHHSSISSLMPRTLKLCRYAKLGYLILFEYIACFCLSTQKTC